MKKSLQNDKKEKEINIYGIYDMVKKRLLSVSLKYKDIKFEFDLCGYDIERFYIAKLTVSIW